MKKQPKLYGYSDAARFVSVSHQRFGKLVKDYKIPYQQIACGKVFFEEDLIEFKKSSIRRENLKYQKNR